MRIDSIVPIIVVLFFVLSGLRKLLRRAAEEGARQMGQGDGFEAPPEEVRRFLESIAGGPLQAAAEPDVQRGQFLADAGLQAPAPRVVQFPEVGPGVGVGAPAVGTVTTRRPAGTPGKRRRRPGKPSAPRRPVRRDADEPPAKVLKGAAVTPLALKGTSLKQAVVWLEILGPPLSLRRGGRRRSSGIGPAL